MKTIVQTFMILFGLQFMAASAMANNIYSNKYEMRYVHNGKRYTIKKNQVFSAQCNRGVCIFRANGLRLSVKESALKPGAPAYRASTRTSYSGVSSELAGSGSAGYTPRSNYSYSPTAGSSRLAQCYQQQSRKYASRGGCTSGKRSCSYNKSASQSTGYCYRYVKLILQDCGATSGYLPGKLAKDAGPTLLRSGFKKWPSMDPSSAPVGAVVVYSNQCRSTHVGGHIEIKIGPSAYASDFVSSSPISARTSCRKVSGIYFK